jgi:hypothetical protein
MKQYEQKNNIGKAKYTISKSDGVQTHKDGSLFWDIAIFKNKKNLNNYIEKIESEGFVKKGLNFS